MIMISPAPIIATYTASLTYHVQDALDVTAYIWTDLVTFQPEIVGVNADYSQGKEHWKLTRLVLSGRPVSNPRGDLVTVSYTPHATRNPLDHAPDEMLQFADQVLKGLPRP